MTKRYTYMFEKIKKPKKVTQKSKGSQMKNQIISFYRMKKKMYSIFFVENIQKSFDSYKKIL